MTNATRKVDVYDNANGTALAEWSEFSAVVPDSYNVYVNNVLNQNVAIRKATIGGLVQGTNYAITVAAVQGGIERSMSLPTVFTPQPSSTLVMGVYPSRRIQPFPSIGWGN